MPPNTKFHVPYISRRNFLQRFGIAALGTTVLAKTIGELRMLNSAMAQVRPPTTTRRSSASSSTAAMIPTT